MSSSLFEELTRQMPRDHTDPSNIMYRALARYASWETDTVEKAEELMESVEDQLMNELNLEYGLW